MKIVIVGGGPAGSTAAKLLCKHHHVTLIQDRDDFDKPCGGGVKTKIFKEFSIPEELIQHKLKNVIMKYKNSTVNVDLMGENLSIVQRKKFDKALRLSAQKEGAHLKYGRFKELQNNKAVIKTQNGYEYIPYDILIAADGVNSTVRKACKLPKVPSTITHYAKTDLVKTDTCEFYFDFELGGEYYAWAFPHGSQTHIGTVKRENFENLCKFFNITLKPKGYKIPTWEENIVIQKNNIFFVGDSAGQVMPLSFEGIYYAIQSAKVLSDSILNNTDYRQEWNRRFLKEFRLMKKLEILNKTKLRSFVIKAHKFKPVQKFSINMWLGV